MFNILIVVLVLIIIVWLGYYLLFSSTSQLLGPVFYRTKETEDKIIALTFDDGPNEPYTSQILEVLKKYNVKATFFPVGQNIIRNKATLKKTFEAGHIIGCHSFSHALFNPFLRPNFKSEIDKSQKIIENIIGKKPALFRPPWFFRQSFMLNTAKKAGLVTITGIFGSRGEVFQKDAEKIAADALSAVKPGLILVFHDGYNNKTAGRDKTVSALEIFIPKLIKDGYKFATVPELLNIRAYQD